MSQHAKLIAASTFATILLAACSGSTGVSDSTGAGRATLTAVSPTPSANAVSTSTAITLTFGQAMMPGMEQYVDLHQGTIGDPTVPMGCGWNADTTVLTCMPNDPLQPGTHYLIHVGAGMMDQDGGHMDMTGWSGMGGQWVAGGGGMMGGMHAGEPMGSMGPGWTDGSGHYGMTFGFTTN